MLLQKRGADGRRTNAWQAIVTEQSKYIKYLGYEAGQLPYEEFYDLTIDFHETVNRIHDPDYREAVEEARLRLMYTLDHYPPVQKTWCTACAAARNIR